MEQGLKPGTTLRDNCYRIEKILGQGGFGITYLAMDLSLDRKVAIKEFFPKDYCDREGDTSHVTLGTKNTALFVNKLKTKFLKEAKNIAKFDNPGIIKIHAAFEENNTAYYVMDFIEGESLSAMVKRYGPLTENVAVDYICQVGKALEYVHSRHINHLDVKPANIMVRKSDNKPILIDFGLSKQYDSEGNQTSTTPTGISHGYAPMEQYNDGGVKDFSPKTDLYSLAATLYYLLSGIVPPQATILVDEELTFPSEIPAHLVAPIAKAMSTARRDRQDTIGDFLDAICSKDDATEIRNKRDTNPPVTPDPDIDSNSNDSRKKWYIIGAVVAVVLIALIIICKPNGGHVVADDTDSDTLVAVVEDVSEVANTVSNMYYKSSLGSCSYSGEVDADGMPHGKGKAEWESGLGKSYDGQWIHGKMDGSCVYISRSEHRFEGKFKDNHYSEGKLISPDKSYYVGTFDKNGDIWTGTDYDAKGNITGTWENGR